MREHIGIFKQFSMALGGSVKPSMYSRLRKQGFGKILLFVLTISLINAAITWLIPGIRLANDDSFKEFFKELPAFVISNNTISVAEPVFTESDGSAMYIDTSVKSFSDKDITALVNQYSLSSTNQIIMISETNIINYQYGQVTEISVADMCAVFKIDYLDNNNIGDYLAKFLFNICLIIMVFATIYFTLAYFVTALLFALIGKIAGALTDTSYSFGEHYVMGIYIAAFWKILSRIILILIPSLKNGPVFFMVILFTTIYIYIAQVKKEDTYNQDVYVPSYGSSDNEPIRPISNPSSYVVPTDDIVFEAPPTKNEPSNDSNPYSTYSQNTNTSSTGSTGSGFQLKD